MKIPSYSEICKPGSGAGAFFATILVWGEGIDRFGAGVPFAFAASMALTNSAFAMTVPKNRLRSA